VGGATIMKIRRIFFPHFYYLDSFLFSTMLESFLVTFGVLAGGNIGVGKSY
jgi:hypothetical protein